jgi:hypothetical protein
MARKVLFVLGLMIVVCGGAFSQNSLANTTWEGYWTGNGTKATIIFGESSFRLNGTGDFSLVTGTYRISGELITFQSSDRFIRTGTLLAGSLTIPAYMGWGFEFQRVQTNSQNQNNSSSNTQNLPSIRIKNSTGYTIYYIYVSPISNDNWGNDVLGDKILRNGETVTVSLSQALNVVNRYDIQLKDEDGDTYTKRNIQVTTNTLIEFTIHDLD